MSNLPDPLVPAEVDLRGLEWMPYYGDRLIRSEFNARCSDAEWRAGHNLWWAAWNSQPAASLPNDDVALTRFADLGRDLKQFKKVKDLALHGFVLCNDGRLYHPFLAELALSAWDRRLRERQRKARWREGMSLTETEWGALRQATFERDGHRCVQCSSTSNLNCDHIVPVSKGGASTLDNMQTLCAACNKRKRDRTWKKRGRDADVPVPLPGTERVRGEERTGDKKYSDPNGSGGRPPPDDPVKALFDRGVAILGRGARSLIGKARRDHGDLLVAQAIAACEQQNPSDPAAFFVKALLHRSANGSLLPNEGVF